MSGTITLKKISDDLDFLKKKVVQIESDVEEINLDIHRRVKPEYLQKLNKIKNEEGIKFKSVSGLRSRLENA